MMPKFTLEQRATESGGDICSSVCDRAATIVTWMDIMLVSVSAGFLTSPRFEARRLVVMSRNWFSEAISCAHNENVSVVLITLTCSKEKN